MVYKLEIMTDEKHVSISIDDDANDDRVLIEIEPDSDYGQYAYLDISVLKKIEKLIALKEQQG